eukprot:358316-Chlamydomonas_euryale.AAC.12
MKKRVDALLAGVGAVRMAVAPPANAIEYGLDYKKVRSLDIERNSSRRHGRRERYLAVDAVYTHTACNMLSTPNALRARMKHCPQCR